MAEFSPDICHDYILKNRKRLLAFDENADYEPWKKQVTEKMKELLGDMPDEKVPLNINIEYEKEHDTFTEKRFTFDTEPGASVPCHLLIPKGVKLPCPVVICLQGHTTGMHISLGIVKYPGDEMGLFEWDRDFGLQTVREGYAALIVEQRGLGERSSERSQVWSGCYQPSMVALLLGRTIIGERVWDVSRAIDALYEFDEIDTDKIACMGNSGGGTATYYAACMDERIKIAMPACSVCTFEESIAAKRHCSCNFIPGMAKYFDMGEIACMIAPRKLVVVDAKEDEGFNIKGALDAYDVIEKIYKKENCPDNCKLVVGYEGHRFYADPSWKIFKDLSGWK